MAKRLFLIDGTALAYRSFFAFQGTGRTPLSTSDGHPTAATYGFCSTLRALLEREKPDAIAISFDGPRSDLQRTKVYPEYKSTRTKMPDEMAVQLDDIREAARGFGLPIVESETHEADDVIGTLAVQGRDAGMEVFVVTGDKDFLQIVDEHIKLWNLRSSTSKPEIFDAAAAEAKWGVPPERMVDLLALMGDSSDNIPGVPKIGQKTAVELLQQFGSLDAILANTEQVTKKAVRASLEENRDKALLSRDLVTLRLDVPLKVAVDDLPAPHPDPELLRPLFQRLEFTNLLSALASQKAPEPDVEQRYAAVRGADELTALVATLTEAERFAIAVETTGGYPRHLQVVGVAFATAAGVASYVPLNLDPPLLPGGRKAVLEALAPALQGKATKVVHDSKRLASALRHTGLSVGGEVFDTMLASYCSEPGNSSHSLEALALEHFAFKKTAAKDVVGTGKKQRTFAEVDPAIVGDFVCEEADLALRLAPRLTAALEEHRTTALLRELEQPLVPVLLDMEWEGIRVDLEHLQALSKEMQQRITTLQQRVYDRVGHEFNLGSPQQLGKVLFEDLEVHRVADLPKPKRTPTGQYKTDHDVLEKLAEHHEVPQMVLEWRQLTKLVGTYVDSLPQLVDPETGRVHTTFNQAVAATGRLSSEDPNLQNIPIRTEEGKKVRAAFVPRKKGWVLLSADYSQIELRILAHLSGDKALVESFQKGEDIHARTAAIVHGMMPALVSPELRNQAKVINYGLMYGMGASRLAKETGMRPPEAKKFIERYFQALPGVKRYLDESLASAQRDKEARTMFGRRRPLGEIDSTNAMQRIAAENMAVNTPIQGAAADIVKRAMLAVHARLAERGLQAKLLLQVHDELVLDVPEDELTEVRRLVVDAMAGAAELKVPLEVSVGSGANWLLAH
ncbi:MAG: DNA polymerase I [Planctomycetes bacterium]|nr:DNA polymerase I [Planctomycetota bacterium]MCB9887015.1 DNA polymerase I [Planctomycetota bacterium]